MILVDVNLLLYVYDSSSKFHEVVKNWWEDKLSQPEPVGLPWATILAFLKIFTNPRILNSPMDIAEAVEIVQSWMVRPMVFIPVPSAHHWGRLQNLLIESQSPATMFQMRILPHLLWNRVQYSVQVTGIFFAIKNYVGRT